MGISISFSGQFNPWIEKDFPFFTHSLDARKFPGSPSNNLTPRAIFLPIGSDHWVCFDTDLMRASLIWKGTVKLKSMAFVSYDAKPSKKSTQGQSKLSTPLGELIAAMSASPGWSIKQSNWEDTRNPCPSPKEVGKGPLDPEIAKFKSIQLKDKTAILNYQVSKTNVKEWYHIEGSRLVRSIKIEPHQDKFYLNLLNLSNDTKIIQSEKQIQYSIQSKVYYVTIRQNSHAKFQIKNNKRIEVLVPSSQNSQRLDFIFSTQKLRAKKETVFKEFPQNKAKKLWQNTVASEIQVSRQNKSLSFDHITLPENNPWKRNLRFSGLGFLSNGTGVFSTFDGDVWLCKGISNKKGVITWSRFASGLDESMSLVIRDDQIFVFTRQGIIKLIDSDQNGEADIYETFCNQFGQTAETREFPLDMVLDKHGGFYLAKGGIQKDTKGKHNGRILHVSPDGKKVKVVADGLREPYLGYNPKFDHLTATDQQGHYVPTTPLYHIKEGEFYGFVSTSSRKGTIADKPLLWIPHQTLPSGTSQTWALHKSFSHLNGQLIQSDYNSGRLYTTLIDLEKRPLQAALYELPAQLPFSSSKMKVNPKDGLMYFTGFRIWGAFTPKLSGLARLKVNPKLYDAPIKSRIYANGIHVQFAQQIQNLNKQKARFEINQFNVKRTSKYGSAYYKRNGKPGREVIDIEKVFLSADQRSVFIKLNLDYSIHCLSLKYFLQLNNTSSIGELNYTLNNPPKELYDLKQFSKTLSIDKTEDNKELSSSIEKGKELYLKTGCIACHSLSSNQDGKVGPSWFSLYGTTRSFHKRKPIKVDKKYLRESILEPNKKIVKGFSPGMPSYKGVLKDHEIESLILLIESLKN